MATNYTLYGIISDICINFRTRKGIKSDMRMNNLSTTVKMLRKKYNLTQEELSLKSGVGLRFVRDLEQGKETGRRNCKERISLNRQLFLA